ncbi:MAG: PaaI family thioesterase [Desulfovibrionaceae bacterium]|nr:PaaI family thioesterase [Desulfovibrionaceae bacterium]
MSKAIKNIIEERDMFARMLGMVIEEANGGYARVSMELTKNHCNGVGMAHGGAIFSLADVAFGAAANSGYEHAVVTLSSNIIFLQPGRVSPLVAEARVIRRGAHIGNYEVVVRDGAGTEVARSQTSGFVTDIPLNTDCDFAKKP